jgi:hypothetical protein
MTILTPKVFVREEKLEKKKGDYVENKCIPKHNRSCLGVYCNTGCILALATLPGLLHDTEYTGSATQSCIKAYVQPGGLRIPHSCFRVRL